MKTLGIGSLPHLNISDAVTYSLKHSLPFLPQMTSLGERMVEQVLSAQELSKKYIALSLFTEKIIEQKNSNFKIQIAGPETCNVDSKIILNEINNFLEYFEDYNLRPIVFIDEPVITFKSDNLKKIFNELANMKIMSGLHSCAKFDVGKVEDLNCDFLSYDAGLVLPNVNSKKNLIAGIPPFSKEKFIVSGEWISSNCGLAMYTEDECKKILINLENYKENYK
jgi:hypothetical protein